MKFIKGIVVFAIGIGLSVLGGVGAGMSTAISICYLSMIIFIVFYKEKY